MNILLLLEIWAKNNNSVLTPSVAWTFAWTQRLWSGRKWFNGTTGFFFLWGLCKNTTMNMILWGVVDHYLTPEKPFAYSNFCVTVNNIDRVIFQQVFFPSAHVRFKSISRIPRYGTLQTWPLASESRRPWVFRRDTRLGGHSWLGGIH